jgi:hypothetical protein
MAEIRIPVEKLPPPDENGDHAFQFRIISVDKNQWSAWSQLYVVKSIGQYRPQLSPVSASVQNRIMTANWVTPVNYNVSASLSSASIAHDHSLNTRAHDTDVFVQFSSGSVMGDFGYLERVANDTVRILIPSTSASVRVIGTIATKNIPLPYLFESSSDYKQRFDEYLGISASVQGIFDLFKIFDTGIARVPTDNSTSVSVLDKGDQVATTAVFSSLSIP